jgi:superfamily II DNA or RNA helicase
MRKQCIYTYDLVNAKNIYEEFKMKKLTINDETKKLTEQQGHQDKEIITLRPYQTDIIEQCISSSEATLIQAPTGSGKTVMAKEIAAHEMANGGKVLIVVPKLALLDQVIETFSSMNPATIHGRQDYDPGHNLFVSTVQTAHKRDLGFEPTLIMIDEIHYGFHGKMIKKLLHEYTGRLIGLSATPYDAEGHVIQGFTKIINKYDLRYLIVEGYLVPPVCYKPVTVDLKGVRTDKGDYNIGDLDKKFNNIESVTQLVGATKAMIINREQSLVFCINIKHAEAVAEAYNNAGIVTQAIHSNLSISVRESILKDFKTGKTKVLTNPDMLTTGFDHPPVDTIVLARATQSPNLYRQIVGRALRQHPNKDNAAILDCAGVIDNLGMPLDPIRPRNAYQQENKAKCCSLCQSNNIYRRVMKDKVYWRCTECGNDEEIDSQLSYQCEACNLVFGTDAKFKGHDESLYLVCTCGHKTLVSRSTSEEELDSLFNEALVEIVTARVTKQYVSWLIEAFGPTFITNYDTIKQLTAIQQHIKIHPNRINSFTPLRKLYDNWRIIPKEQEERLQPKSIQEFEDDFLSSAGIKDAIRTLNELMIVKGMRPLSNEIMSTIHMQLKHCMIPNIEAKIVTRLKNIYKKGESVATVESFIPYIDTAHKHVS